MFSKKKKEVVIKEEPKKVEEVVVVTNNPVEVVNNEGELVRTYTHSKYGVHYRKLAGDFALRTGNVIKNVSN